MCTVSSLTSVLELPTSPPTSVVQCCVSLDYNRHGVFSNCVLVKMSAVSGNMISCAPSWSNYSLHVDMRHINIIKIQTRCINLSNNEISSNYKHFSLYLSIVFVAFDFMRTTQWTSWVAQVLTCTQMYHILSRQ